MKTEIVLVETVSMFRMRYAVEVPVGKSEWALDTVVCNEAKELSQTHIDENIVSHRVISKQEFIQTYKEDNAYPDIAYPDIWTDEKICEVALTEWVGDEKDEPLINSDGYPNEYWLNRISESTDATEYINLAITLWNSGYGRAYKEEEGEGVVFVTGGWSGNEDVIRAMKSNLFLWAVLWKSSERGGKHVLDIGRIEQSSPAV